MNGLEAAHHAVAVRTAGYEWIWSLGPERALALLNSNVARSLAVLQANTAQGLADNASLDLNPLPQFPKRAIVEMPAGYTFEAGVFTFTPPTSPE